MRETGFVELHSQVLAAKDIGNVPKKAGKDREIARKWREWA